MALFLSFCFVFLFFIFLSRGSQAHPKGELVSQTRTHPLGRARGVTSPRGI